MIPRKTQALTYQVATLFAMFFNDMRYITYNIQNFASKQQSDGKKIRMSLVKALKNRNSTVTRPPSLSCGGSGLQQKKTDSATQENP